MGKRYMWLMPVLVLMFTAACGGGGVNPFDKLAGISNIDDACQALSAEDVNEAMGVSDVKLVADVPFKNLFTHEVEPGRECGYLNKMVDSGIMNTDDDVHGITFSVSKFSDEKWKFDDGDKHQDEFWEKVDIGDLALQSTVASMIVVRNGDWVIVGLGVKAEPMTSQDFRLVMRELTKSFVSKLPRA